ncbi:MAG: hypothetical protein ABUK01_00235 [Leptospirales bacterium]
MIQFNVMKELLKKAWFKISAAMALAGFVISFIFVLTGELSFFSILLRPLLSAVVMGALGFLLYKLIQMFIPEFVAEVDNILEPELSEDHLEDIPMPEEFTDESEVDGSEKTDSEDAGEYEDMGDVVINEEEIARKKGELGKRKGKEDEIVVQGIPMKKDPDLMAKAVQHVLDSDDDD